MGRMSNLIGAAFSEAFSLLVLVAAVFGLNAVGVAALLRGALVAAGFVAGAFEVNLVDFTVALGKTGFGMGFVRGRGTFLGATAFALAFFGVALPGFLADLFGFFEGI
jgi:hypothetical protein